MRARLAHMPHMWSPSESCIPVVVVHVSSRVWQVLWFVLHYVRQFLFIVTCTCFTDHVALNSLDMPHSKTTSRTRSRRGYVNCVGGDHSGVAIGYVV